MIVSLSTGEKDWSYLLLLVSPSRRGGTLVGRCGITSPGPWNLGLSSILSCLSYKHTLSEELPLALVVVLPSTSQQVLWYWTSWILLLIKHAILRTKLLHKKQNCRPPSVPCAAVQLLFALPSLFYFHAACGSFCTLPNPNQFYMSLSHTPTN